MSDAPGATPRCRVADWDRDCLGYFPLINPAHRLSHLGRDREGVKPPPVKKLTILTGSGAFQ
jgi:hypothetical protein